MENYRCPFTDCTKRYRCKANLNRHLAAIHATIKKFECQTCGKILSSSQNLREHSLLHSKLFPFVCKEKGCGKRFRHGSQFSAHKRVHKFTNNLNYDANFGLSNHFFNCKLSELFLVELTYTSIDKSVIKSLDSFLGIDLVLPKITKCQEFKLPEL